MEKAKEDKLREAAEKVYLELHPNDNDGQYTDNQMWFIGVTMKILQCEAAKEYHQLTHPLPTYKELDLIKRIKDAEGSYENSHRMLMEYMHLVENYVGFAGPIERVKEELDKLIQNQKD